jgi:hypothetical protein
VHFADSLVGFICPFHWLNDPLYLNALAESLTIGKADVYRYSPALPAEL